jgi:hypothetical protein
VNVAGSTLNSSPLKIASVQPDALDDVRGQLAGGE